MSKKYTARSASDRTEDWPFWFVCDDLGINVTAKLLPELSGYLPLVPKGLAIAIADNANSRRG